jgi:hypothetical protein
MPFATQSLARFRLVLAGATAVVVALTAGCTTHRTLEEVQLKDDGAASYTGAVYIRPESLAYGRRGHRGGFEAAYERYRGEDTQEVDRNHYLLLDNVEISGPQTATTRVKIDHGHIGFNHLLKFGRFYEFEPMLGLSFDRMTMTAQGSAPGSPLLTEVVERWGALVAVTPRFNLNKYVGIEARISAGTDFKRSGVFGTNFSMLLRPVSGLTLKAGYYSRSQEIEPSRYASDLDAGLQGFNGGITFDFR